MCPLHLVGVRGSCESMVMDDNAPLVAMLGSRLRTGSEPIRRFEVLTGVGRRRSFAVEEKLALVAQMADCGNICELARRHDLRPSQLFTWRRELRYAAEAAQGAAQSSPEPMFVPAVIAPEPAAAPVPAPKRKRVRRTRVAAPAAVELEIDGVAVKIARGADAALIAAVIDALRA